MTTKSKALQTVAAVSLAVSLALPTTALAANPNYSASISPIREIARQVGANVEWNKASQSVTVTKGETTLILTLGKTEAILNGKPIKLKEPLQIMSNQTLVSTAFITEIFANPDSKIEDGDVANLFIQALQLGDGDKAASYLSPALHQALTSTQLKSLWSAYEGAFGKTGDLIAKDTTLNNIHTNTTYLYKAELSPIKVTVRINSNGLVDDLNVAPFSPSLYEKPTYDQSNKYVEEEITIGKGTFALPGTLTKPVGDGPFPVIVLVHGSGPNDRDSSIGGSKPFRDLAVGLAAEGIATLRYDKVTYEHTWKVSVDTKYTMKQETVDDALLAVQLLKETKDIDAERIFVAGHSQGGFMIPVILDNDKARDIAGTIVLSGPSSKFVDVAAAQQQELISRLKQLGMDSSSVEPTASVWKSIADMVNDPQYSVDNIPAQFPLSPAYYWFEQKDYSPVSLAKLQSGPMLVLQGENDWQVPISELDGWKSALKARQDVKYKSYPKVNHLLSEVDSLSIGTEYNLKSNVSKSIIDDIASWVKKAK